MRASRRTRRPSPFRVVGVGASAGGLDAFTELLQNLPPDTGLGFVLVQHLDPNYRSGLAEILGRATAMPVEEAVDGAAVRPNRVLVGPPDADLSIERGTLRLTPRGGRAPRLPIDAFFRALARDMGRRAIGVVLSGTASDGTRGLEALRAEGGVTFAQDASAKYRGMPESAVRAGAADFVLPARAIAARLAQLAAEPPERRPDEELREVLLTLRGRTGVDFLQYKPATLRRRVRRRMAMAKCETTKAYLRRLKEDADELSALFQDLLISVTSFFRDPGAFAALKSKALAKLVERRKPDEPVRVWVSNCSTGEEAYSIAMQLAELFESRGARPAVQVFATDVNETLLEKARAGVYPRTAVAGVAPERLKRFFVREDGGYRIAKPIRELCVFAKQDVLQDPPLSRMDLISSRNLLIYLDAGAHKRILQSFHYALKPGGFLFLGASETVGPFGELFACLDKRFKLYSKRAEGSRAARIQPAKAAVRFDGPPRPKAAAAAAPAAPARDPLKEADRVLLDRYAPGSAVIDRNLDVLQFRGSTGAFLAPPRGRASLNLLKMVRPELAPPLRGAVAAAERTGAPARRQRLPLGESGTASGEVVPLKNLAQRCYLVVFSAAPPTARGPKGAGPAKAPASELQRLRRELRETRDFLENLREEHEGARENLQTYAEEVQSSNEELQSINEELETSKEELESTNEELTTVNDEMANRNAELLRATGDLNNLLANLDMAIVLLDGQLRIRSFTSKAGKLFNLLLSDVGRPLAGVRSQLDFAEVEILAAEARDKGAPRQREVRDKSGRVYSLRAHPYLSEERRVEGAVLILVDIDDLKRTQAAIEAARRLADAIVETVPPLLILDEGLRVRRANRSFLEAFLVPAGAVVGRPLFELGAGQWDIPQLRELLESVLPRDKAIRDYEVSHDFPGLGPRTMLLGASRFGAEGLEPGILLSIQDITGRKQAEDRLKAFQGELERTIVRRTADLTASNTELEAFSYSVAHDLRTPLRGIDGFGRLLLKDFAEKLGPEGRAYIERIRAATQRMASLIDGLLDLAQLTRSEMRTTEVDLSAIVGSIADSLRARDPRRDVRFTIAPGLKTVGDERMLRIALENLLENAWKFTSRRADAAIEFGASERGGARWFFVRDNGSGFDMEFADRLFKPFQRLHAESEYEGSGIGLATAERIMRRHGGSMRAEGVEGRGATFYFTTAAAAAGAVGERRRESKPGPGRRRRRDD